MSGKIVYVIGPVTEMLTLTLAFAASCTTTDVNPLVSVTMLRVEPDIDAVAIIVSGGVWIVYGPVPPESVALVFEFGAAVREVELAVNPAGVGVVVSSSLHPVTTTASAPTSASVHNNRSNRLAFIEDSSKVNDKPRCAEHLTWKWLEDNRVRSKNQTLNRK
jgi:hypothetical protein